MKQILISFFVGILILAGCRKEMGEKPYQLELSKETLNVEYSDSSFFNIVSGNGGYLFKLEDSIVSIRVNQNRVILRAIESGATKLHITDRQGRQAILNVIVGPDPNADAKSDPTLRFELMKNANNEVIKNLESDFNFYKDLGSLEVGAGTTSKTKLGWVDSDNWQYCFVLWDGDFSVGNKTGAILRTLNADNVLEVIDLKKMSIIKAENGIVWVTYEADEVKGLIVQ